MTADLQVKTATSAKRLIPQEFNAKLLIIMISQVWSWLFLLAVITYFSIKGEGFFTIRNSQNILTAIVPIVLMGIGQTYVIITGGIDLSVGWVMGLSSVISAKVMQQLILTDRPEVFTELFKWTDKIGLSANWTAIIIGFLAGFGVACLAGLINGAIIAKLRVPPFIVTLGVSFVARGIGWILSDGNVVGGLPDEIRRLGLNPLMYVVRGEGGGIYFFEKPELADPRMKLMMDRVFNWPVVITFFIVILAIWLLHKTKFGRHTFAIGGNREAALRAGVPVDRHIIMLYTLSGATAGIAGFLYNARFVGGSAKAGDELLMMSIAAVVIGGVSMMGGAGRMSGTLVGALILAVLETGLVMTDVETFYKYIVVGIVIILAVLIDQARDLVIGRAEAMGPSE